MTSSRSVRHFLARALLAASAGLLMASVAQVANAAELLKELRPGFQKGSVNLVLLKQSGRLEQCLKGTRITWLEFPAGHGDRALLSST